MKSEPKVFASLSSGLLARKGAARPAMPEIGAAYRELIGKNFPTMAVVQVAGLVERDALIEIETTAVVPEA